MFQRGWFLIETQDDSLSATIARLVRRYGIARVRRVGEDDYKLLREPGSVAGMILELTPRDLHKLEQVRSLAPRLPVLGLVADAERAVLNALQERGAEVALLPVHAPNVVSFAQRALSSCFLPHDGVARTVAYLAQTQGLSAREVQILTFCLGNEPRERVRRRLGIEENTLKTQIKSLLRKCNERSVDALAKNVLRSALLARDDGLDEAGVGVAVAAPAHPAAFPRVA